MTSGSNGEAGQWPSWPPATAGTVLLDVVVDLPVDELFKIMYGGDTDFRVRAGRGGERPSPGTVPAPTQLHCPAWSALSSAHCTGGRHSPYPPWLLRRSTRRGTAMRP